MLKDGLDEITEELAQTFEEAQNTIQYRVEDQLMRYITDPNWLSKQIAARGKFKINLLGLANKELRKINQQYDKAFRTSLKNADTPINKEALKRLQVVKNENARMMLILVNKVYNAHLKFVNSVSFNAKGEYEIGRLEKTEALYNQITKVLNSKEAQEEFKAAYKGDRQVSFKAYMEMNARTTLNQEIGKQQMEAAPNNGDVFWLCNSFEDCRPSHLEYQGRVYYDERYTSYGFNEETIKKIEEAIAARNMISRQEVEDKEPYLGNCPNCRHEFVSVPIDEVIQMTDTQLLKENNMNVTHATEEKYRLSQRQRLYERKIREYKFKVEKNQKLINNAPKGVSTSKAMGEMQKDKKILNRYYIRIRKLVSENPTMERDYTRENVKILREDLGYRYNHR